MYQQSNVNETLAPLRTTRSTRYLPNFMKPPLSIAKGILRSKEDSEVCRTDCVLLSVSTLP
jgi:hypothetical protein